MEKYKGKSAVLTCLLTLYFVLANGNQTISNDKENFTTTFQGTLCYESIMMYFFNDEGSCGFWPNQTFSEKDGALSCGSCMLFLIFNENHERFNRTDNTINVTMNVENSHLKFTKQITNSNCTHEPSSSATVYLHCGTSLKTGHEVSTCLNNKSCDGENRVCHKIEDSFGVCVCLASHIPHGNHCIPVGIPINGSCQVDGQCKGTNYSGICKNLANKNQSICSCEENFVYANGVCLEGKRHYFESCQANTQCNENLTCKQIGKEHRCICPDGYEFINYSCLRVNIPINSSCQEHRQCAFYGDKTYCSADGLCACIAGMEHRNNTCYEVGRVLGSSCVADFQCTGSKYAGLCGQNNTCDCDLGYMHINDICAREDEKLTYWISALSWVFEGIGCFLVGICCTTGILKRAKISEGNKTLRNRLDGTSACREYSVHGEKQQLPSSSLYCDINDGIILTSRDANTETNEHIDDVYNHLHETREETTPTGNVYGVAQPL